MVEILQRSSGVWELNKADPESDGSLNRQNLKVPIGSSGGREWVGKDRGNKSFD